MRKIFIYIANDYKIYPPTVNAANILAEQGWEVELWGLAIRKDPDKIALDSRVKARYIASQHSGIRSVLLYFYSSLLIFGHCLFHRPNWILGYDGMAAGPVMFTSLLLRIPAVYHQHDYWEKASGWLKIPRYLEFFLGGKCRIISFPQEERFIRFCQVSGRSADAPHCIVFNAPPQKWADNSSEPEQLQTFRAKHPKLLIYQGGMAPTFGLERIIRALAWLPEEYGFVVMGKSISADMSSVYRATAEECKVSERFLFWGHRPYAALPDLTCSASLGVAKFTLDHQGSLNDTCLSGASNKLAEYFACSLPVLAPDTLSNRAFFEKYQCGILVDGSSPEKIAEGIRSLLEDTKRTNAYKGHNRKLFIEEFCYEKQFSKLLQMLNESGGRQ